MPKGPASAGSGEFKGGKVIVFDATDCGRAWPRAHTLPSSRSVYTDRSRQLGPMATASNV